MQAGGRESGVPRPVAEGSSVVSGSRVGGGRKDRFYSAESPGLELGEDCTSQLLWEAEAEGSRVQGLPEHLCEKTMSQK